MSPASNTSDSSDDSTPDTELYWVGYSTGIVMLLLAITYTVLGVLGKL
jgi:hypothetical protein